MVMRHDKEILRKKGPDPQHKEGNNGRDGPRASCTVRQRDVERVADHPRDEIA